MAADGDRSGPGEVIEVSDGIHAYVQNDGSWWINNTGFIAGAKGIVSVDTCATDARTRAYLAAIARISAQPVRTVVNTHHHGDHTFGNYLVPGATIVGQERSRAALQAWGLPRSAPYWTEVEWGDIELAPPFLTFEESVNLYVDDLRCEVRHLGHPAHTNNDTIVWIPERRVLFAGDLVFNGGTPFVFQGSVAGALETLADLADLDPEVVVPGHGPIGGPELFGAARSYLEFIQDVASRGVAAGIPPLDAALDTDLGEFSELLDRERIVGNLHRAYAEERGEPWGIALAADPALADMVRYNRGQPLSCHA